MAGTFSQVYMQYVFAVKGRENLIRPGFETEVLVGLKPAMRISDLVRDIKNNSSNFINEKGWLKQKFSWQEGYGVFSYSESNFGKVIDYIKDQKRHHERRTFRQEYLLLLKKLNISFEEKYLFEFYN